jgi:hypothetical protein
MEVDTAFVSQRKAAGLFSGAANPRLVYTDTTASLEKIQFPISGIDSGICRFVQTAVGSGGNRLL